MFIKKENTNKKTKNKNKNIQIERIEKNIKIL